MPLEMTTREKRTASMTFLAEMGEPSYWLDSATISALNKNGDDVAADIIRDGSIVVSGNTVKWQVNEDCPAGAYELIIIATVETPNAGDKIEARLTLIIR
jgi:hypothetical protein